MIVTRLLRAGIVLLLAGALGACGIFGNKDDEELPPK